MRHAGYRVSWGLVALAMVLGSCFPREQAWELSFDPADLEEPASRFLVEMRAGGCEAGGDLVAEWEVTRQSQALFSLSLPPGRYGLSVRAVNVSCQWYASGCADIRMPRGDELWPVVLRAQDQVARCAAASCDRGRCRPGTGADVGPGDAFLPDAMGDGGTGRDAVVEADVTPPRDATPDAADTDGSPADATPAGDASAVSDATPDAADTDGSPADATPAGDASAVSDATPAGDAAAVSDATPAGDATAASDATSDGSPDATPADATVDGGAKAGEGGLLPPTFEGHDGHRQLDAEQYNTCAIRQAVLWCWGDGGWGPNGDGTNNWSNTPVRVVDIVDVQSVAVGDRASCALDRERAVWCWGDNQYGQLGQGDHTRRNRPQLVASLPPAAGIAAAGGHVCARTVAGEVYCWGRNHFGQLGIGTTTNVALPQRVPGLHDVRELTAGPELTCALDSRGQLRCWGSNWMGERGENDLAFRTTPGPVVIDGLRLVSTAKGQFSHTCGLSIEGVPSCWGGNWMGQLGDGTRDGSWEPRPVLGLMAAQQIVAGRLFAVALDEEGTPWTWGNSGEGRLGRGGEADVPAPVNLSGMVEVAAGRAHACARNEAGNVWCWGLGDRGQLGYGERNDRGGPTAVAFP